MTQHVWQGRHTGVTRRGDAPFMAGVTRRGDAALTLKPLIYLLLVVAFVNITFSISLPLVPISLPLFKQSSQHEHEKKSESQIKSQNSRTYLTNKVTLTQPPTLNSASMTNTQ